jgi:hypothetical protein
MRYKLQLLFIPLYQPSYNIIIKELNDLFAKGHQG